MCQLFAIILKTDRRDVSPYRRVGTEEQDAIAYDALRYPEVFLVLAQVLQSEEELLVGEVQQVAGRLAVIPTGGLQQSAKEVEFFIVLKDVGHADGRAVVTAYRARKRHSLYLIIISYLGNELNHAAGSLISGVFRWAVSSIMKVGGNCRVGFSLGFVFWLDRDIRNKMRGLGLFDV